MPLRDYQSATIAAIHAYNRANPGKNPCVVLPTGAGKSVVLAELCRHALQNWPDLKFLMLTDVKELVSQNAAELREMWPGAPLGIYSAGLRRKQLGHPITFAGIQSIERKVSDLGHIDVMIVDECHMIHHKDQGRYRKVIAELRAINPRLRVIGLTATPWRLGHGLITEGDSVIFHDLIQVEGTSIQELVDAGHLAPLSSKHTNVQLLDLVKEVEKRGGDFVESQLAAAVNKSEPNQLIADEIIRRALAADRKHWLLFCVDVAHAQAMAELLTERGHPTGVIHGAMEHLERTDVLTRFRVGELRAVTNVNVLTKGYNFPAIDLLGLLRPTLSPVLYVQQAGRGMRLKPHTDSCTVLDFAGLVATHGPVTEVRPPKKKTAKPGEAPVKPCPECDELVSINCHQCPACGYMWPVEDKKDAPPVLHNQDIMGDAEEFTLEGWRWSVHVGRESGKPSMRVDYTVAPTDRAGRYAISEFFTIWHGDQGEEWARQKLRRIADNAGVENLTRLYGMADELATRLEAGQPPERIKAKQDGKFWRVTSRKWPKRERPTHAEAP